MSLTTDRLRATLADRYRIERELGPELGARPNTQAAVQRLLVRLRDRLR